MLNSFTIKQDLTLKDFFSSTVYYYLSGRLLKRFFLFLTLLMLLSTFVGPSTTFLETLITIFVPIIILLLMVITGTFFICVFIYNSKPYLFKNVSYNFTHWGIVRHGERTEFSKPWREISKFKETKSFFLLYIQKTDFHIIQKRMFNDANELNDFRILLKENITH